MSLSTTSRRLDYVGDDVTKVYPYTFKIFQAADLSVIRVLVDGTSVPLALGIGYTLSGVGAKAGGSITLSTALLDKQRLIIYGSMPLDQKTDIRNQGEYYPATIEDRFDKTVIQIQQVQEVTDRAFKLGLSGNATTFSTTLPTPTKNDKLKILRFNLLANAVEYVDATQALSDAGGGATGTLKAPTDGTYGGPLGNPSKVAIGDLYEDAFDKVATLLSKMVPVPPDDVRNKLLTIVGSYMGLEAGTGALHLLTDVGNPVITPGLTANIASGFSDPDAGTLTAQVDGAAVGVVTLTAADNTGLTNGQLLIIAEFDPYAGQGFGKQDIFKAITARIQAAGLAVGAHSAQLIHSLTGSTAILAFFVDDPATPIATAPGGVGAVAGFTPIYKSGVPSLPVGAALAVPFSIANAVRTHYNPTRIARVATPQSSAVDLAPSSPPAAGAAFAGTAQPVIATGAYSEDIVATVTGYNSKGTASTPVTVTGGVRVDTVGSEAARLTSGTGQYPTTGYGGAYDSTVSLASTKGLQYLNGRYQYPPLVSYAAKLPSGPDYTGLTPDSYASMRWVTFALGSISNASAVTFAIQNALNITGATLITGMAIYVRVDGAGPTAGWIDANAAYPGVGNPTNNGDAALDVGNSTALSKRVTFGGLVKTGTVYVRIGIPSGSNKSFGGIA